MKISIPPMNLEQLATLSHDDLWKRMDAILAVSRYERNPYYNPDYNFDLYVKRLVETETYQNFPNELKRKFIWMCFDFIVQMEYLSFAGGFFNSVLDSRQFEENEFLSPTVQFGMNATHQTTIIGSRIAFERLMHLIYFGFTQSELSTSETFSSFRKWIFSLNNLSNLVYIIPFLPMIRKYDKKFRTAEVHSGSILKREIVQLRSDGFELGNAILDLQNLLTNLFPRVIEIFNHQRPSSIFGKPGDDTTWITHYLNKDENELNKLLEKINRLIDDHS